MALLGNIIWFVVFGWWNFLIYALAGIVCCITIIGIPIGKSMFQYAKLMALPFGKVIVKETDIKGVENVSAIRRVGGVIANILWLPFGICFFLASIIEMIASAITIIGIPAAVVLAKSCKFLLWPIGAKVITQQEAQNIQIRRSINAGMQNSMKNNNVVAAPQQTGAAVPIQPRQPVQSHFCAACGTKITEAMVFCPKCGAKQKN